jgi:prepilin-type processing-associated H-X9-DG protein
MRRLIPALVCLVVCGTILDCLGFSAFGIPLMSVAYLAIGWIPFLWRVIPEIRVNGVGLLSAFICLVALAAGMHLFLRWLSGQTHKMQECPATVSWKRMSTIAIVSGVVLLFVAGISAVGVTHQAAWLVTSREPLLKMGSIGTLAARTQSMNNLKQMSIAAHEYHEVNKEFPPGASRDDRGWLLHGWQTLLLPFVEKQDMFNQIDLAVPWNHPKNAAHFREIVFVYQYPWSVPDKDSAGFALTHYAANVRVMRAVPRRLKDGFPDGTSNTIMFGEVNAGYKPWGAPGNWRDPAQGINTGPRGFGSPSDAKSVNFAFADGSVRPLSTDTSPHILKALSTPDGGEQIDEDF